MAVRVDAEKFFYEVDIRSQFVKLAQFCSTGGLTFESNREQSHFLIEAKKFYFMYVMNLGGQSGYKEEMLRLIHQGKIYNEIKEIMTSKMHEEGCDISHIRTQFSDFHAVIRNERQIFFYYGFLNGNEKADLSGFYTMTRLGKLIIQSTSDELLIIWEHQKIRMLSQSPETKINLGEHNVDHSVDYSKFSINYHPYLTLLRSLSKRVSISREIYQFLIARFRNGDDVDALLAESALSPDLIEKIKRKVTSFNRKSDIEVEDFGKEFKKYVLGISSLPYDKGTNLFAFLSSDGLDVTNAEKIKFVVKCYQVVVNYLDSRNGVYYKIFERSLRDYYMSQINGTTFEHSREVLYEWHRYIISPEMAVMLTAVYVLMSVKIQRYDFSLNAEEIKGSYKIFKNILAMVGIGRQIDFIENILRIQSELFVDNLSISYSNIEAEVGELVIDESVDESSLSDISTRVSIYNSVQRKRSSELIDAMRSYYMRYFKIPPENLIKCDACEEKTFLTRNKYAYLEFHHLIPFSTDNGPDHYLNIFGICPNCHRKFHHAIRDTKRILYEDISRNNNPKITLEVRIDRLYKKGLLEPLNVEFLRKEGIITDAVYNNYMDQEVIFS